MKTSRQLGEGSFSDFSREQLIDHIRMLADLVKTLRAEMPKESTKSKPSELHAQHLSVYNYLTKHHGKPMEDRVEKYGHANISVTQLSYALRKHVVFQDTLDVVDCLNDMERLGYIRYIYTDDWRVAR